MKTDKKIIFIMITIIVLLVLIIYYLNKKEKYCKLDRGYTLNSNKEKRCCNSYCDDE
jgi:ABC-type cobalt transport system substrate-binding protein